MNEKIIVKYMEQLGISPWQVYPQDMAKFAELIVKECIEICRSDDWEDQRGWGKFYGHQIKKHFGVEE